MKLKVNIIKNRIDKQIDRLIAVGKHSRSEILDKTRVMFLQSAAITTPPGKGNASLGNSKGIPVSMRKRAIREYPMRNHGGPRGFTHVIYKVFIQRRGRPRIIKESVDPKKLQKYLQMDFRGIGKAGWWGGLAALGASTAGYYAAKGVRPILNSLCDLKKSHWSGLFQYVSATNKVKDISSFGYLGTKIAFHKTAKRLAWWANNEMKKKMVNSWRRAA